MMLVALAAAVAARLVLAGSFPKSWLNRLPWLSSLVLGCVLLAGASLLFGLVSRREVRTPGKVGDSRPGKRPIQTPPDARIIRPNWSQKRKPGHFAKSSSKQHHRLIPNYAPGALVGLSIICWATSLLQWNGQGESLVTRILWLLGVLLLPAALLLESKTSQPTVSQRCRRVAKGTMVEVVALVLVLVLAFGLRFANLSELPLDMHGDMASHAFEARELLHGTKSELWAVGYGEVPMMGYVPMAVSLGLFGDNLFGFRMSAVIESMVSLVGLYLLARELYGKRVAWVSVAMLTLSYAHIHFSRVGQFMDVVPWVVFSLFFTIRGINRSSNLSFAMGGLVMGLGVQMYYASRILLVLVPAVIVWRWLVEGRQRRSWVQGLAYLTIGFVVALGPMLLFTAQNPQAAMGRSRTVSLLNPPVMTHLQGKYGVTTAWEVFAEQAKRSLLTFYRFGDASTHFSLQEPMVGVLGGCLFALGLGYVLLRLRQTGSVLMGSWVFLTVLLGSIVTNDAPTWPHIVAALLPLMALAALAVEQIWSEAEIVYGRAGGVIVGVLLAGTLVWTGVANWKLYVNHSGDAARPRTRIGRYVAELPTDTGVYIIADPFYGRDREIRFLSGVKEMIDIDATALALGQIPKIYEPTVFFVTPNHMEGLDRLRVAYPVGTLVEHHDHSGHVAFFSWEVSSPPSGMKQ